MKDGLSNNTIIGNRKNEHIEITKKKDVQSTKKTWLESITLIHNSLPEINFKDIDLSIDFLGKRMKAPILIEALTGGTSLGKKINDSLSKIAHKYGFAMMVGSQRVALDNSKIYDTFSIARKNAPDIPLIANIGAIQIKSLKNFNQIRSLIEMIEADALAIHLNSVQECIQYEGESDFSGIINQIESLQETLTIPIIIKETGAGLSKEVVTRLLKKEINIYDVSGIGGTSFAAVESYRSKNKNNKLNSYLGKSFWNWGIPTAASIIETRSVSNISTKIIGSGGIRSGIDIAKSIAIGADLCGLAKPFLDISLDNEKKIKNYIELLLEELKMAMFLTGSLNIKKLKQAAISIGLPLSNWIENRKINLWK